MRHLQKWPSYLLNNGHQTLGCHHIAHDASPGRQRQLSHPIIPMILGQPIIINRDSHIQLPLIHPMEPIRTIRYRRSHINPMHIGLLLRLLEQPHHILTHSLPILIPRRKPPNLPTIPPPTPLPQPLDPTAIPHTPIHPIQVYLLTGYIHGQELVQNAHVVWSGEGGDLDLGCDDLGRDYLDQQGEGYAQERG